MKPKNGSKDPKRDNCQTPEYAIDIILKYIPKNKVIWESAVGEGIVLRKLKREGYKVKGTDIKTGTDFFKKIKKIKGVDIQLTNVPFSKKYKWLEESFESGIPFFLLVPLDTLGSTFAQSLFKKYGVTIHLLNKRINYKMPNKKWEWKERDKKTGRMVKKRSSSQFASVWLSWNGIKNGKVNVVFEQVLYTKPETTI